MINNIVCQGQIHYDDDEVPAGLPGQPGAVSAFNQFTGLLGSSTRQQGNDIVYARIYRYESNKGYLPAGHQTEMIVDGGLPESYTLGIDNDSYFARPKAIVYPYTLPNGDPVFSSYIQYNKQGYITQEGGSQQYASGGFYRRVETMSAFGTVTREQYGNGLYQHSLDYPATGQLADRYVSDGLNGPTQLDYSYAYDRWGNLNLQTSTFENRAENFSYDQLHRLTGTTRQTSGVPIPEESVSYAYDALGNFSQKSDFASQYSYGNNPMGSNCNGASPAGPNAVTGTINGFDNFQYAYDANGNMLCSTRNDMTIRYDGFNKPQIIEKRNGEYTEFSYGPDNARYAQQGTRNSVRYINKLYERINQSTHKLYLGDYAILTYGAVDPSAGLVYQHRDRLGSMVGLSDANGELYTDGGRAFDAFGKPREGDWKDSNGQAWPAMGQSGDLNRDDLTSRGFTQHEHLNGFDLIHMNGRAYDYNLGRFLSVDPIIQFPENSQSLNPYSYIMNNPMSGTDPTGYACNRADSAAACAGNLEPGQSDDIVNNDGDVIGTFSKGDDGSIAVTASTGVRGRVTNGAALSNGGGSGSYVVTLADNAGLGSPGKSRGQQNNLTGGDGTVSPWQATVDAATQYGPEILRDAASKAGTEIDNATGLDIGGGILEFSGVGPGLEAAASSIEGDYTGAGIAAAGVFLGKVKLTSKGIIKASETIGLPVQAVIGNKKRFLRVDIEPNGKLQIQSGRGKKSIIDFRPDLTKPLAPQINKAFKRLPQSTRDQLIKNAEKGLKRLQDTGIYNVFF